MELPKSITQIGEADPRNKIYVEDYAVAYMKQLCERAVDKPIGIGLYGTKRDSGEKSFYFVYAIAKLGTLAKEVTHLSAAQKQEIDKIQKLHFKDYAFLGYRILDGSQVEGFYLFEQGIGRYTSGYAQFSEKNDVMLNYMMDFREDTPATEVVDATKYEEVKQRQEKRREEAVYYYRKKKNKDASVGAYAAVACAALLGVTLYKNWENPVVQRYVEAGKETVQDAMGYFAGDEEPEGIAVNAEPVKEPVKKTENETTRTKDILVVEDALNKVMLEENEVPDQESSGVENSVEPESRQEESSQEESSQTEGTESAETEILQIDNMQSGSTQTENIQEEDQTGGQAVSPEENQISEQETQPVTYEIKRGDTLISICLSHYGSQDKVNEICSLNHIGNPDNIEEGWKIILP